MCSFLHHLGDFPGVPFLGICGGEVNMNDNYSSYFINRRKMTKVFFDNLWFRLLSYILNEDSKIPYPQLRVGSVSFTNRIPITESYLLVFAVMRLLVKYAYTTDSSYGKFTIRYCMKKDLSEDISFTLGKAITFRDNGKNIPVYALIEDLVRQKGEEYADAEVSSISIHIYLSNDAQIRELDVPSDDDISKKIWECVDNKVVVEAKEAKRLGGNKKVVPYPTYITSISPKKRERQPFIVADTETVLINNVHVAYAVGFLVVRPDDVLSSPNGNRGIIETSFSEDYYHLRSFEERSHKMLFDFIERLSVVVKKDPSIKTVYFHNLGRFDGILLLKYLVSHDGSMKYSIKPIMRNNLLYEISIYCISQYKNKKMLLFRLRDSLRILPNSLDIFSKNLCPELGSKGMIQHEDVNVSNLIPKKKELLEYMKQDILLLGGVMLKAQSILFEHYKVDIVTKLTLSSLALSIFRTSYYDQENWAIHIPNNNEDDFLRRGYYGGHSDTYLPRGENLYYYDVNSLYPFVMKTFPMPAGKPVWKKDLEKEDLDNLFGFIEAYVECPENIKRPFLPFKERNTLLFPVGKFIGVYYSEEFKYAKKLGYTIIPLSGYLFENHNSSPFGNFVTNLFESRQEAKKIGNDSLSFIYKLLMNSLYGRFGINPKCTVTEICKLEKYNSLRKDKDFFYADRLSEDYYIVNYWSHAGQEPESGWSTPRISAVQLAAAVTACSRIYMYPYISRDDCYYTDTDSVVLGSPLPDEDISSTVLGKFQFEYMIKKGIFLAPKSYYIETKENHKIIKHKGAAKSLVDDKWFEEQYKDTSRIKESTIVLY